MDLRPRMGVHTGPLVAGVIGSDRYTYDVWGDTVNVASRLESTGAAGEIHISATTARLLDGAFALDPLRGGRVEAPRSGRGFSGPRWVTPTPLNCNRHRRPHNPEMPSLPL